MATSHYDLIRSTDALKALIEKLLADNKPVGFDVETAYTGPDRLKGALQIDWDQQFVCGFSLTNATTWARYVPVAHDFGPNLPEHETWELMKPVLETLPIISHNSKYEIRNLRALERKGRGPRIDLNVVGDSMIESYIQSRTKTHGLKALVKHYFSHEQTELKSLFPGAKVKDLAALRFSVLDIADPDVVSYACEDAIYTLRLYQQLHPLNERERPEMHALEMKILWVLCDMEDAGHAVDWAAIQEALALGTPFEEEMKASAKGLLSTQAGEDLSTLNLASAMQMRDVLYNKIGLTTTRMTGKGEASTDAIALEALSREHVAVKKVLEVREVHNLTNRLGKWLNEYTGMHDSRVHASFNQVVVPSGRFSANDPAVQQLPKEWRWSIYPKVDPWNDEHWAVVKERSTPGKHHWDGNFRNFMVAAPGCYLLGFDYSQIELRALAGMSREPSLLKAFNEDRDVHTLTAAMMLGIPVDSVTSKTRAVGKTMNFALLYGMAEQSLSERLAITYTEAQSLYQQYFSAFTLVTDWMNEQKRLGLDQGYVETAFKRKVTIWELASDNRSLRGKGERLCVNAPVQGTAADIMKEAMWRASIVLKRKGWWQTHVRMVNNIHDALVFEVNNEVNPHELREILRRAVVWDVTAPGGVTFPKIVADWELGQQWGSSVKWTDEPVEFYRGQWMLTAEHEPDPEPEILPAQIEPEPVREEPDALVVELTGMPKRDGWERFTALAKERDGTTRLTVKTTQGEWQLGATGLSIEDQGEISLLLGGARVYRLVEDIDAHEFTEGLEL